MFNCLALNSYKQLCSRYSFSSLLFCLFVCILDKEFLLLNQSTELILVDLDLDLDLGLIYFH